MIDVYGNLYSTLLNFTAAEPTTRYAMNLPFRLGDFIYATDGKWAARIPADAVPADAILALSKGPPANEVFDAYKPTSQVIALVHIDAEPCKKCGDVGSWTCSECEHEHDCQECDTAQPAEYLDADTNAPLAYLDRRRVNRLVEMGFHNATITKGKYTPASTPRTPVRICGPGGLEILLMQCERDDAGSAAHG